MSRVYHSPENQKQFRESVEAAGFAFLSDADLKLSLEAFMAEHAITEDVWVFGYGSLICNPQLEYAEKQIVALKGLQRSFCIRSIVGYGIPEKSGLMLAVEEKEHALCTGVAYKIEKENLQEELYHYWQREMRGTNLCREQLHINYTNHALISTHCYTARKIIKRNNNNEPSPGIDARDSRPFSHYRLHHNIA